MERADLERSEELHRLGQNQVLPVLAFLLRVRGQQDLQQPPLVCPDHIVEKANASSQPAGQVRPPLQILAPNLPVCLHVLLLEDGVSDEGVKRLDGIETVCLLEHVVQPLPQGLLDVPQWRRQEPRDQPSLPPGRVEVLSTHHRAVKMRLDEQPLQFRVRTPALLQNVAHGTLDVLSRGVEGPRKQPELVLESSGSVTRPGEHAETPLHSRLHQGWVAKHPLCLSMGRNVSHCVHGESGCHTCDAGHGDSVSGHNVRETGHEA
mmetsp:Transcript_3476/g.8623  ORF Transcript_3476/g.8623 Transcript_3476/m.8623 type:complete len:263 (+) Transcript_3476:1839-2627(+)